MPEPGRHLPSRGVPAACRLPGSGGSWSVHFTGHAVLAVALASCGGASAPASRTDDAATRRAVDGPATAAAPVPPAVQDLAPTRPEPPVLAAAGLRVELPGDWRVVADDDPWSARAHASAGSLLCMVEWWPAGLVPDEEHREIRLVDRPGRLFAGPRGAQLRVLERDGAVLACSWGREDASAASLVEGVIASLRAVDRPARPARFQGRYRRLCSFRAEPPGGPAQRRVLALGRDGVAWLGDPASGELRRIDGEDHRTISCHEDRGLLLTSGGALVRVGLEMSGERVVPGPSGLADDSQVVALASQFLVRADGRLFHWNYMTEGQTLSMRLPRTIAAAWGSGTDGCVLAAPDRLWCWGSEEERREMPPVRFTGAGEVVNRHTGAASYGPESFAFNDLFPGQLEEDPVLDRRAGAMCVQARDDWHCIDRFGGQRRFPACSVQSCRCIVGRRGLQCSDTPLVEPSAAPPDRRIDDVVLTGPGACFERRDGAITCLEGDAERVLRPQSPETAGGSG